MSTSMAGTLSGKASSTTVNTSDDFAIHEDRRSAGSSAGSQRPGTPDNAGPLENCPAPLTPSRRGNVAPKNDGSVVGSNTGVGPLSAFECNDRDREPMDALLAALSEQQAVLEQQQGRSSSSEEEDSVESVHREYYSASVPSTLVTPASGSTNGTELGNDPLETQSETEAGELRELRHQLLVANDRLEQVSQELVQQQIHKHTLDQAMDGEPVATPRVRLPETVSVQSNATARVGSGPIEPTAAKNAGPAQDVTWNSVGGSRSTAESIPINTFNPVTNAGFRVGMGRENPWVSPENGRSAAVGAQSVAPLAAPGFGRFGVPAAHLNMAAVNGHGQNAPMFNGPAIWNDGPRPAFPFGTPSAGQPIFNPAGSWTVDPGRPWLNPIMAAALGHGQSQVANGGAQQAYQPVYGGEDRYMAPINQGQAFHGPRRATAQNGGTVAPVFSAPPAWGPAASSFHAMLAQPNHPQQQQMTRGSMLQIPGQQSITEQPSAEYQPRPIGTPLSPTAPEFTMSAGADDGFNDADPASLVEIYVPPVEPLNYRRLLERNVWTDWRYIVDKIIHNNDQQASIFLQQKLKACMPKHRVDIVDTIVASAYPLMVNRFGNFLIQRAFEHGTPEQVVAIANTIRGNVIGLSTDAFGCHVVQKAFDSVPEEYKAMFTQELLRRIPQTVIHRYACHVWQKLFELRWKSAPPQIMKHVNEALHGMWTEVALGETGSLVVQNIFENCREEDKRPCLGEVLSNIDTIARGQFGNWCIQHLCEHGAPPDMNFAIDHVIRHAIDYSMDQYASKVIEKNLKIGGPEFLDRYLSKVCEGQVDQTRIPLIDISSDQYGNYLIQYVLTHSTPAQRELVASHVRRHMVSLRGSKFGSRVAMLCCNPASATRPGPGTGVPMGRFPNPRFGGSRYS
ncbi:MAG: hypothetical protein M1833_001563 [Piccolia ochrophora]|nr:MAG: hypothetical protein M1833_001563 [Piccolia ochrophora]